MTGTIFTKMFTTPAAVIRRAITNRQGSLCYKKTSKPRSLNQILCVVRDYVSRQRTHYIENSQTNSNDKANL